MPKTVEQINVPDEEKTPENGWFKFRILRGKLVLGTAPNYEVYAAKTDHDVFYSKTNMTKHNCIKSGSHRYELLDGPEKAIQRQPLIAPGVETAEMTLARNGRY